MPATYSTAGRRPFGSSSVIDDSALLIGRIVLVAMYVFSGADKFMNLSGIAAAIGSKGLPMPMVLAVLAAAGEVIGGLLIAIGLQTRLAASGLLIFTMVASYFFHAFWLLPEGAERMNEMIHFMKNASLCGAFLMLIGVGPGRYSVDFRAP